MKVGILNLEDLDKDYVAIVQLRTQAPGVIHQVALRPEKILGEYIRLGETPGVDELTGWQAPKNIMVLAVIGTLHEVKDSAGKQTGWTTKPDGR